MNGSSYLQEIRLPCGKTYTSSFKGILLHFKICKICDGTVCFTTDSNLNGKNANRKTNKENKAIDLKTEIAFT